MEKKQKATDRATNIENVVFEPIQTTISLRYPESFEQKGFDTEQDHIRARKIIDAHTSYENIIQKGNITAHKVS